MARKQLSGINQHNTPLTNVPAPTSGGDAANKTYVDNSVKNRLRIYDVRDYGAVADGTTNDATAIKSAMDAANAAGGGIVQLMPGVHAFTASITGAYKNVTVRGYPNVTVCKATASFTNGMFNCDANITSTESMVFEDIFFDVNSQANVQGVTIKGGTYSSGAYAKNFTFRRVSAKNLATVDLGFVTIYTGRGSTDRGKVTDISFIECDFQDTVKYHVYIIGGESENIRFTDCKFRNSQYGCIGLNQPNKKNSAVAIGTRSSKSWLIEGCLFTNNHLSSTALAAFVGDFNDSNRSGIRSLKFLNCRFEGNGVANTTIEQYAMSIHSSWDVVIQGCTFWKIRTFLNVGQSYNGPWYQEDGTQFLTIRDNTFYQLYNIVDNDSAFFATWDNNKFIEIFYGGLGGYSRHWPSVYSNNYFYNTPTDPTATNERTGLFYIDGRDGFEVRNNIVIDDRKLANPTTAPTTSIVSGGALSARTYYVKYTYRNDTGATLASSATTQAVTANNLLKFDFPYTTTYGPPSGAKWVDIYVGTTAGSETLQTSQPVAWQQETETVLSQNFGPVTWTEPSTGLVAGTALPSTNTTKTIAKYAIYEGFSEVGGPRYVNHYNSNRVYGMDFLRRNTDWNSVDHDNWYVIDTSVSSLGVESNPSAGGGTSLPSQTGKERYNLATDGTNPYWQDPSKIGGMLKVVTSYPYTYEDGFDYIYVTPATDDDNVINLPTPAQDGTDLGKKITFDNQGSFPIRVRWTDGTGSNEALVNPAETRVISTAYVPSESALGTRWFPGTPANGITANNGLTKTDANIQLGGNFDEQDIQITGTTARRFDVNIKDGSTATAGLAISNNIAQLNSGTMSAGSSNISLYPALAGFQVSSPDEVESNILIHKPTETQITAYPNSRDDSAAETPTNFIYTDVEGNLRSAPTSEISSGGDPLDAIVYAIALG